MQTGMAHETLLARMRHDAPTVLFHWSRAAIIMLQFINANIWGLFYNPLRHQLVAGHLTAGMVLSVLLPLRIAWRIGRKRRIPASDRWRDALLACSVEYSRYRLAMMEIGLGYLWRWGNDKPKPEWLSW